MARSPLLPFRELLVEAFKELDVPTPQTLLEEDEGRSDPRDETKPDRRRPVMRESTLTDAQLPWALRTDSLPPELDVDDAAPRGEQTRPVDLKRLAATIMAAPPSLPVAIGAHTGVYRFTLNATDTLEPLEPLDVGGVLAPLRPGSTPAPVPEAMAPLTPTRARRASGSPKSSSRRGVRAALDVSREANQRPTSAEAPTPATPTRRPERGPRPPSNRERAKVLYLAALDALSSQRVDEARTLCSQAVTLAPKEPQYRALFQDLSASTPSTTKKRPTRS
jgi:hypothetical protein